MTIANAWPIRSCIIISVLAIASNVATLAGAQEIIRVDNRIRSEDRMYSITLSAQSSGLGHSFIVWNKEDDQKKLTTQEVVGFYPPDDKSTVRATFGFEIGQIIDDAGEKADLRLVVALNSEQYERARGVYDKWKKDGKSYTLGFRDCTTFVGEIATAAGLATPFRAFVPFPIDYLKEVIRIKAVRDENISRHRRSDPDAKRQFDIARSRPRPLPGPAYGPGPGSTPRPVVSPAPGKPTESVPSRRAPSPNTPPRQPPSAGQTTPKSEPHPPIEVNKRR